MRSDTEDELFEGGGTVVVVGVQDSCRDLDGTVENVMARDTSFCQQFGVHACSN